MSGPVCPYPADSYDVRSSFSQATRFSCPWSWYAHYELKIPEFVGNNGLRGRGSHLVFGNLASECLKRQVAMVLDGDIQRIYRSAVRELMLPPEVQRDVSENVRDFIATHQFPPEAGVEQGAEQELWFRIEGKGVTVVVLARVDHYKKWSDGILIQDYKTSQRIISTEDFLADWQGPTYGAAALATWPELTEIYVVFDYVARDYETDPRLITALDINKVRDWFIDTGLLIKEGRERVAAGEKPGDVFEARPGRACHPYEGALCPVIFSCPYREKAKIPAIRNDEDAKAVLEAIAYREARNIADQGMLQAYMGESRHPLRSDTGTEARWDGETRTEGDMALVLKVLDEGNYDLTKYLRLATTPAKHNKTLWDELQKRGAIKAHKRSRFVIGKQKKATKEAK